MLGVSAEALGRHGAVSEPTVREMAQGALAHSHAHVAAAISGVPGQWQLPESQWERCVSPGP